MNPAVNAIARAVLYEGYVLYPYRASAAKNRHRWTPGGLLPRSNDPGPSALRTECLVRGDAETTLTAGVRFLHALLRTGGDAPPAQEATEREIALADTPLGKLSHPRRVPFEFPPALELEGEVERLQHAINGMVEVAAEKLADGVFRVAVRVENLTPPGTSRDDEALRTLSSAHVVLHARGGEFVSLTDPPAELRAAADACRNEGVWSVLVGEPGARDTVLASPIILPDYPRVAPESPGDFFDGTEIDEMLTLRVLTLTDDEKREMAADPRSRAILRRVETLPESVRTGLHGAVRSAGTTAGPSPGARVRLHPRGRADALDVLLAGKVATVVSVETDFEGTVYVAVTMDDDPGRDLGGTGKPGHRFFFRLDEVESLAGGEKP